MPLLSIPNKYMRFHNLRDFFGSLIKCELYNSLGAIKIIPGAYSKNRFAHNVGRQIDRRD